LPSLARMNPKPLSLTSRLIVPFIGAIAVSSIVHVITNNALWQGGWSRGRYPTPARRPVGAGRRRLAYVRARFEYTSFDPA
jgi:hypothetical protein